MVNPGLNVAVLHITNIDENGNLNFAEDEITVKFAEDLI